MERLLTEAREISRIDADLDDEERTSVALDQLLAAMIEGFRFRLGETGPQFEFVASDSDVTVSASADRLTQVFENLIDNAVSFSPVDGKITVTLTSTTDHAEVAVADQGPGIPEGHRDRIFGRFFSYRPEDDTDDNHTGLGLALVRAIIEAYGGTVTAEPGHAGGATIVVRLPLLQE